MGVPYGKTPLLFSLESQAGVVVNYLSLMNICSCWHVVCLAGLAWEIQLVMSEWDHKLEMQPHLRLFSRCWNPHSRPKTISRNNLPVPLEWIKVEFSPLETWNADVSIVRPLSQGTDWGLTHKTSVFQIFHGVNSSIITSFDKTKFSRFILQSTQHYDFFRIYFFFFLFVYVTYKLKL